MRGTVANMSQIMSLHLCSKLKWKIQGIVFEEFVRLLRLGVIT